MIYKKVPPLILVDGGHWLRASYFFYFLELKVKKEFLDFFNGFCSYRLCKRWNWWLICSNFTLVIGMWLSLSSEWDYCPLGYYEYIWQLYHFAVAQSVPNTCGLVKFINFIQMIQTPLWQFRDRWQLLIAITVVIMKTV